MGKLPLKMMKEQQLSSNVSGPWITSCAPGFSCHVSLRLATSPIDLPFGDCVLLYQTARLAKKMRSVFDGKHGVFDQNC